MLLINNATKKAMDLDITQLRTPRVKTEGKLVPFVNTNNPGVTNIFTTMKANLPILFQSPKMRSLIKESHIINSKRQSNNLKQLLIALRVSRRQRIL